MSAPLDSCRPAIWAFLSAGGRGTLYEIAGVVDRHFDVVRRHVLALKAEGLVRIAAWGRDNPEARGPWRAVWAAGPEPDVEKPPRTSVCERVRKHQAKVRKDPEAWARQQEVRKAYKLRMKNRDKILVGRKFRCQPVPHVVDPLLRALEGR